MNRAEVQQQWERAAPGWAQWEPIMADALEPATQTMLTMADIGPGAQVLDLACGAGSQTLLAARQVDWLAQSKSRSSSMLVRADSPTA